MRLFAMLALLLATPALAQAPRAEHWIVATDMWGTTAWSTLDLVREGGRLSGTLDGDPLDGTIKGKAIRFIAKDAKGTTYG
ncbi:MAG: acetamidase, partial [Sphingomonadales bacterium]